MLIDGEPGVGKTCLVEQALTDDQLRRGRPVLWGRCNLSEAADVVTRVQRLQTLREDYRPRVATARSTGLLGVLVDALFETPALTIPRAQQLPQVTHRAALMNIDKLIEAGILEEFGDRSRNTLFLANGIIRAVEGVPEPTLPGH